MTEKTTELKQKIKPKQTERVMSDPDVKKHLEKLHQKFVFVTINKTSNNFAFMWRKYYISKLLAEVSPNENKNTASTYSQTQKSKEEIVKTNIEYNWKFSQKNFILHTCLKRFGLSKIISNCYKIE